MSWLLKWRLSRLGRRAAPAREFVLALERRLFGRPPRFPVWKMATASTSIILSLGLCTASYAYTSDDVLPDHPLYAVRSGIERIESKLAVTSESKENVRLLHLHRRLHETELTSLKGRFVTPTQIATVLNGMDKTVQSAASSTDDQFGHYVKDMADIEEQEMADLAEQQADADTAEARADVAKDMAQQAKQLEHRLYVLEYRKQILKEKKVQADAADSDEISQVDDISDVVQ